MSTNNFLDINRIMQLIKRIFYMNKTMIVGSFLAYAGILLSIFIIYLRTDYFNDSSYFYSLIRVLELLGFWGIMYFMGKIVSEMHKPTKAFMYLTLPASNLEKFMSLWLSCSVIFTILIIVINYVMFILGTAIKPGISEPASSVIGIVYLKKGIILLIIQAIFFAGAVYFKKNHFLKVIMVFIIIFITIILSILLFRLELGRLDEPSLIYYLQPKMFGWRIYDIAIYYLFPAMLLVFSYFRVKEKEI